MWHLHKVAGKLGTIARYVARHQHLPEGVQEQEDAVVLLQDVASDGFHGLARQDARHHVHGLLCQGRPGHLQNAWPSLHSPAEAPYRGIPQPGPAYACLEKSSLGGKLDEGVRHHDDDACLKTARQTLTLSNNSLNLRQHLLASIQQPLLLVCTQHQVCLHSGVCC